ncbi:unnamed protein product [Didymodactylos carnosus]|uniref:Uncharacterized protein n=1 Tax=Didymodactylos carnosus TaxID=1234261 RepID=A0A8S2W8U4_9BILA|nr:unnamed protein product [Didymodactylos carnosus]
MLLPLTILIIFVQLFCQCNSDPIHSLKQNNKFGHLTKLISVKTNSSTGTKAVRAIQCRLSCIVQLKFDSSFNTVPSTCGDLVTSDACVVRVIISYTRRIFQIYFETTGDEVLDDPAVNLLVDQLLEFRYGNKRMQQEILFACRGDTKCDLDYVNNLFDQFGKTNQQLLYDELGSLLFNNGASNVQQCYTDNNIANCAGSACGLYNYKEINSIDRFCDTESSPDVGIDIERYKTYPPTNYNVYDGYIYICNRNLCNSPDMERQVEGVIGNYDSFVSVVNPSTPAPSSAITINNNSHRLYLYIILSISALLV